MDIQSKFEVQYENFITKLDTVAEIVTDVQNRIWNLKTTYDQHGMLDTATVGTLFYTLGAVRDSIEWENHQANEILDKYNQSRQEVANV